MVNAIEVDARKVTNMISGYTRTIPEGLDKGLWNLAQYGAKAVKLAGEEAGLEHWGGGGRQLFSRQTRAEKVAKFVYVIKMPIHGVYLDRMRKHFVEFKKGRLITKWARDRGLSHLPGVWVKRHPFINAGVRKIQARTREIVQKEVNKKVRREGR